jgi:hypothetical protein
MPLNLQQNILAMSEIASNSDSSIFRVLVKNLIYDRSIWEKSNAEIILKDHQIIQAAFQNKTLDMLKKMLAIVQIFTITQLSCGTKSFEKNILKKTSSGNHWGYSFSFTSFCLMFNFCLI